MVGLDPVLRAMDVALQLRVAQVAQGVEAADQFVELEDRPPCRVRSGVGAQLSDQRTLRHFLEAERGDDRVDVGFLVHNRLPIDRADGTNQAFLVERRIVGAVELLQLRLQIGEARLEAQPGKAIS